MTVPDVAELATAGERPHRSTVAAGVAVLGVGFVLAVLGHRWVPQVGVLTWAVALGVGAANLNLLPRAGHAALGALTKRLLRVGVMLLGFSVSFTSIAALGVPVTAIVVTALVATMGLTIWLGRRLRLSGPRTLLIGTGVAICGASAIAAMEETAGADEEDVTAAVAMITLCGTVALVALPLLQRPLGLSDLQFGVWSGASVHEVGQVVAAASPAGAAVVATAVVVKLTRVLLLAPVVATVGVVRRLGSAPTGDRPALVPVFVLGFLACAGLRTVGVVPASALGWISVLQITALGAALFGMGASVHIASLVRRSAALVGVAVASTLVITGIALVGVLLVVPA